jgi:hypothetical protein
VVAGAPAVVGVAAAVVAAAVASAGKMPRLSSCSKRLSSRPKNAVESHGPADVELTSAGFVVRSLTCAIGLPRINYLL